jgi:hypothetical protein
MQQDWQDLCQHEDSTVSQLFRIRIIEIVCNRRVEGSQIERTDDIHAADLAARMRIAIPANPDPMPAKHLFPTLVATCARSSNTGQRGSILNDNCAG